MNTDKPKEEIKGWKPSTINNKNYIMFFKEVIEFYKTANQPINHNISIPTIDRSELKVRLLREEVQELEDAIKDGNLIECTDAFADLMYILCGGIIEFGLGDNFIAIFKEVHRSNMTKFPTTNEDCIISVQEYQKQGVEAYYTFNDEISRGIIYRSSDHKVLKAYNYSKPNLEQFLNTNK